MENGLCLNRMSRDLIFNGILQTLKGNIKVQDVKYQLAQKADTIPQLLIAFTKFGVLEDNTELFKVYQNIYVYSIGYLIEKLKFVEQNCSRTASANHIQLNQIIRSVKNRMSIEMDSKYDQRQYNSVDFNQNQKKYKSGLDYVQEQIKKKLQQQNTSKDFINSSNNYYCQIQKTEESIKQYDDIRNTQTSTLQQGSRIYFNISSAQQEFEKQISKLSEIIETKEYQIKQLQDQNIQKSTKIQIQVEQIENQEKYLLRLKQQELKYIKLMVQIQVIQGTVSEYIQKIIVQISQKIERKQKSNQEKSSPENFNRQIQSARAEYAAKMRSQQLFVSNSKFQSILNSKLIDLQNQMTETKLLSQQIDDLIQAAEFLELDSSFRFDFE